MPRAVAGLGLYTHSVRVLSAARELYIAREERSEVGLEVGLVAKASLP